MTPTIPYGGRKAFLVKNEMGGYAMADGDRAWGYAWTPLQSRARRFASREAARECIEMYGDHYGTALDLFIVKVKA